MTSSDWLESASLNVDAAADGIDTNINEALLMLCLAVGDILRALQTQVSPADTSALTRVINELQALVPIRSTADTSALTKVINELKALVPTEGD